MAKSNSIADHQNNIKSDSLTLDQCEIFYRRFQAKAIRGCKYLFKITKAIIALSFLIAIESTGLMGQTLNVKQAAFVQNGYGSSPTLLKAGNVFVAGNYAYVTGQDYMQIIEITSPGNPIPRGIIYNGQSGARFLTPTGIFVSGSYAYIVTHSGELEIINVSDPDNPTHTGYYTFNVGQGRGIHVLGNYAYIASATNGTTIVDVSKPAEPQYVGFIFNTQARITIATVKGITYAFMVNGSLLRIANISNPLSPVVMDLNGATAGTDYTHPDFAALNDVAVAGNNVFVTSGNTNQLVKINVANMASPQYRGTMTSANINNPPTATPYLTTPLSVWVFGSQVYVHGALGTLMVADTTGTISNAGSHRASLYSANMANTYGYPTRMAVAGNHAYIPGYASGTLTIVDVSNPASPAVKKTVNTGTNGVQMQGPRKVVIKDNFAYLVSNDDSSLEIINISNPYRPLHASKFTVANGAGNGPRSLFVLGTYAYIGTSNSIEIVDVANPYFPVWVSRAQNAGAPSIILNDVRDLSALTVGGKTFVAAASRGSNSVAIIDVTNPASPAHKATVNDGLGAAPFLNSPTGIFIFGTDAYVLSRHSTNATNNLGVLQIINLSNLAVGSPTAAGFLQGVGSDWQPTSGEGDQSSSPGFGANRIVVAQIGATRYAYIADTYNYALKIVNVTNSLAPVLTGNTGQRGSLSGSKGIALFDRYALVTYFNLDGITPGVDFGVDIWDVSNPALPVHVINPTTNNDLNGTLRNTDGNGANLYSPISIAVAGTYAYVAVDGFIDQGLSVLDLYSPDIASVSGFSPPSGTVGSSVTVNGSNFNTLLTATLDGIPATVSNVTQSSLTLTVPPNATTGKIAIFGSKELARSGTNFLVIPNANPATAVTQNSFTANWSDVGATTYFLDVSNNNSFSTFIASNNNRNVGNVTSASVSGLAPGTNYFYRIRSNDGTTSSGNSSFVSVLTIPATPNTPTANSFTQSGFNVNWSGVGGTVSNYFLDVANDNGFANFVPGYNNLSVPGNVTTQVVSGLNPGTYFARVRSANASGSSTSSATLTVSTVSANPVAIAATAIGANGFTANWQAAVGATKYFLDISTDNFATFVSNFNNRDVGNVTSFPIPSLLAGISYQYRVRAFNNSGTSGNSNIISVLTIPAAPVAQTASSITNNSFTVRWIQPTGATDYFLEVSANSNLSAPIFNNSPGNVGSFNITGLTAGITYYYRVTAINQTGSSTVSNVVQLKTLATPATTQVSGLTFSTISSTSVTVNFSAGNGTSRLVVASIGSPLLTALPINQTSYTASTTFGSGSSIGNGFVVSNSSSTSVTVTNLAQASVYFFQVFEFTGTGGTENYLTTTATNNPASQATLASTSTLAQPTSLIFSSITTTTLTVSFTAASGSPSGYLVIRSTSASAPLAPVNGTTYTTGSNYGSDRVAYSGSGTSFNDSGLNNGTTYYYTIYSYSGSGSTTNYLTINPLQNSVITIPAAPAIAAASAIGSNGFMTNWSTTNGAVDYLLDISTDNFNTLVPGYSSLLVGSVTTYQASGLIPGTTYQYRVRARNNSGVSISSNTSSVTTLPAPPTGLSISNLTDNSFTLSWLNSPGATGYFIDISPNSSFSTLTYSNINAGDVSSFSINGLSPGITYYARVRASNTTGSSLNSSSVLTTTYAATAIQQSGSISFSNVNSTSITANFTAGSGTSHLMVVSFGAPLTAMPANGFTYTANSQFGQGFPIGNGFVVSTGLGPVTVTNLQPTSLYFFQIFTFNGSNGTQNYNIQTVVGNPFSQSTISFTPLEQPTNLLFSGQTSSSVNISFTPALNNPSGYLVLRTVNTTPSVAPVNGTAYTIGTTVGNAVVASVGPSVSFFDGGLPTGVNYFYTVYAYNGIGSTSSYLTTNPLQRSITLDTAPPLVTFPISNPTSITEGNTPLFNATATDNVSVTSVKFYYRGISKANFKNVSMTPGTNNNYSVQIQSDWYDSLGLEYYVLATDQNKNTSARGASLFARLIKPSITLPSLPTGVVREDYRIISFPYLLTTNNDVTTVYSNVPWNDNTKAGLWWWNPSTNNGLGDYDQYGKSPTLRTIDPGKGYWAITRAPVTPQLTNVPAPNYSNDKMYQMNLKPGWNQIGNPYPVSISWDQVIQYNEALGSAQFGKLNIFDGKAIREATGNTFLKAFEGGFVKNLTSSDITITIPLPGQVSGGRIATTESSDVSQDAWKIFLHIQQSGINNELGGFGMHPKATTGEDRFDNFNIPAFVNAPELQFWNKETPKTLYSTDIVNTQRSFLWRFKPQGMEGEQTRLSWNDVIKLGDQGLYLYDEENLNIIDMSQISTYTFRLSGASSFKIYFGKDALNSIESEKIQISDPYPNPVSDDNLLAFKFALPQVADQYSVNIQIFNLQGVTVHKSEKKFSGGFQRLEIAMSPDLASATYLFQVVVSSQNSQESRTGKIIKK